ncbi:MAG: adenosylcobinamide amidohydrolase [Candidatus Methanomethylophilaceae archaeon]|nr:adenosylcobinamide amidohydrolase [Candidatus Methanomethylophilaceae archaeon]
MASILGRYELVQDGSSVRIDLGRGHTVLSSSSEKGLHDDVMSIGFGSCGCDVLVSENPDDLRYGLSEMTIGSNAAAAVAIADLGSGICRAGLDDCEDRGEVSLILFLGASFSVSSMARAGITSMEAITAAIQDLGLRTADGRCGSGARNLRMAIVSDTDSELRLRGTGKHSRMGEAIGKTVYQAVLDSATKNGVKPQNVLGTLLSKGFSEEYVRSRFPSSSERCHDVMGGLDSDDSIAIPFSSLALLDDEIGWGLIPEAEGKIAGRGIIRSMLGRCTETEGSLMEMLVATLFEQPQKRRCDHSQALGQPCDKTIVYSAEQGMAAKALALQERTGFKLAEGNVSVDDNGAVHLPLYGACFLDESAVAEIGPLDPSSANERFRALEEGRRAD